MRVLLIEDDPSLGAALRDHVASEGHAADWSTTLADAAHAAQAIPYDLILLDLALPDGQGLDLLRALRHRDDRTPVIILTARDRITERIAGLDAGADDYLVKPFDLLELTARIRAVARRYAGNPNPRLVLGPYEVDVPGRALIGPEGDIRLTAREWAILEALLQRPRQVVSKAALEERLYAFDSEVESNAIEAHVSRLRKKLGFDLIRTRRGLGYVLEAE